MSLEQVLNPQPEESVVQPETSQPDAGATPEGNGEPTAPETHSTHVPLAALEAERKGRQDWKERAIRYEEELKQLRIAQQQAAQPLDSTQAIENRLLHWSERAARKEYGDETVDKAFARFQAEIAKNPALYQAAMSSPDPWDFVVKEGQKALMLEEVGTDPAAYRAKLEAEIRAQLQSQAQPQVNVPTSLNGARSVAQRSAPTWTGPTPLDNILGNRN